MHQNLRSLLLLVGLLTLAGIAIWKSYETATPTEPGIRRNTPTVSEQTLKTPREPTTPSTLERLQAQNGLPQGVLFGIEGSLRWADGAPAVAVPVILRSPKTGRIILQKLSDSQGHYSFVLPAPRTEDEDSDLTYDVHCLGVDILNTVWPDAIPSAPPAQLDLTLARGRPLLVEVFRHADQLPASGVHVLAQCSLDNDHEILAMTNRQGQALLGLPHEGPWKFQIYAEGFDDPEIGLASNPWIDAKTQSLRLEIIAPPQAIRLQAHDALQGNLLTEVHYRPAGIPEDMRYAPSLGRAILQQNLKQKNGRLDLKFEKAGRAYIHVEADGYLSEVVECVASLGEIYDVPLTPLQDYPIAVTRAAKPFKTKVFVAISKRSMVVPTDKESLSVAYNPQCGKLQSFTTDEAGRGTLHLPNPATPGAPQYFDLWIQNQRQRRFFGSLHTSALPRGTWHFELEPPTGTLVVQTRNRHGVPMPHETVQILADLDPAVQDSADQSRNGQQKRILNTDQNGQLRLQIAAPSHIRVLGARNTDSPASTAESFLAAGQTLELEILAPQKTAAQPLGRWTSGRVSFTTGVDFAQGQRSLGLVAVPREGNNAWSTPLENDGSFRFHLPPGSYRIFMSSESETAAVRAKHFVQCQAGDQGVLLQLPAPAGLRLQTLNQTNGRALAIDSVELFANGEPIHGMQSWDSGDSVHLSLFVERVGYRIEATGYVPVFGEVQLHPGAMTTRQVLLDPGRTLDFQTAEGAPLPAGTQLEWMNPPQEHRPYPIALDRGRWDGAPCTALQLRARWEQQAPVLFEVAPGTANQSLRLPPFP